MGNLYGITDQEMLLLMIMQSISISLTKHIKLKYIQHQHTLKFPYENVLIIMKSH